MILQSHFFQSPFCAFFFIPLLIPLNMLGGAVYGAYVGTLVALAGVTLGTAASVFSARHVFKAVPDTLRERRWLRGLLERADRHRNLAVVLVRFSVVIPYLYQNIALAATRTSTLRITLLTLVSAIPGAAIYSCLGAGLVRAEDAGQLVLYIALPVLLMIGISIGLAWVKRRYET